LTDVAGKRPISRYELESLVERLGSCLYGLSVAIDDGGGDVSLGYCCREAVMEYMDYLEATDDE
jgi:hypothetical protein